MYYIYYIIFQLIIKTTGMSQLKTIYKQRFIQILMYTPRG
jgi:hypothetical protein